MVALSWARAAAAACIGGGAVGPLAHLGLVENLRWRSPYLSRGDGHGGGGFRVLEEGLAKARSSGFDGGRRGGRCSCLASVVNWAEGAAYVQYQQCHAHWRSCRFAVHVWFVSVCLILRAVVRGTGRGGRRRDRRPPWIYWIKQLSAATRWWRRST